MSYRDDFEAEWQVDAEEALASILFDDAGLGEEEAAELGRRLLLWVLERFRPDLCEPPHPRGYSMPAAGYDLAEVMTRLYDAADDAWTSVRDAAIAAGLVTECPVCGDDVLEDEACCGGVEEREGED